MIKKIPKELLELYGFLGLKYKLYTRIRWKLCPFEELERYVPKEGTIIDIGCGYGLLVNLMALKSKKRKVTGLDLSVKRINIARESAKNQNNIKFLIMDVTKDVSSLKIDKCDCIIMSDFLHHIPYEAQVKLLSKVYKNFNKNATLIILDVDKKPLWKYFTGFTLDFLLNIKRSSYRSSEEFKKILSGIGFNIKTVIPIKGIPWPEKIYICQK